MKLRAAFLLIGIALIAGQAVAIEPKQSLFDQDLLAARYSLQMDDQGTTALLAAEDESGESSGKVYKYKSPGKAFLLSAIVPGLGQYYYGSRIKPWLFFGADVASWALYFKWHGEGNDLTDDFEAFQRAHWSRDSYAEYLQEAYGVADDDLIQEKEVSHHLPDTETGQYFEMTGKYPQFAWGWDDAALNGQTLDELIGQGIGDELRITGGPRTPASANRQTYEEIRHDANSTFDKATNMVMVALANRLISGFEAYFTTKSRNKNAGVGNGEDFSQLHFETSLKSYNTRRDTPFITAYYKF